MHTIVVVGGGGAAAAATLLFAMFTMCLCMRAQDQPQWETVKERREVVVQQSQPAQSEQELEKNRALSDCTLR